VPTASVRAIVQVPIAAIVRRGDLETVELDEEHVPVVRFGAASAHANSDKTLRFVVVLATREGQRALMVDAIDSEQELVFRELKGLASRQRLFAGASILGDGEIVPIVDVDALASLRTSDAELSGRARRASGPPRVLVVEDSPATADMQCGVLTAAGFEVAVASDGEEALRTLAELACDLVVADIDMPRMNGLELTRQLRREPRYQRLPVIIVTGREAEEDRRLGLAAGADAFIVKRDFDAGQFVASVRRLLEVAAQPPGEAVAAGEDAQ
jgi:two-component system chemotaxis sensor kinase CheA